MAEINGLTDIMRLKQAQEEYQKFVTLAEASDEFIAICDLQMRLTFLNEAGCRLVGLGSVAQGLATPARDFFFPEDQHFIMEEFVPAVLRDGRGEIELRFRHFKTGQPVWMISSVYVLRDPSGQPTGIATVSRDITERKLNENKLRTTDATLRRLKDSNIIGIVESSVERLLSANDLFLQMVGYTRQEMEAGQISWAAITPPEYLERSYLAVEQLRQRGACTPFEKEYIRKDGSRVPVLVGAARLNETPQFSWICFVIDLSERKRAEAEMKRAREMAEAANSAKDEFLATVSHELRTPLAAMLLWANLIKSGMLDEERTRRALDVIVQCAEDQSRLVDDLLNASRVLYRKVTAKKVPINLKEVVAAAANVARPAAEEKGVALDLFLADAETSCDPALVGRVITNLLSNAMKYTAPGGRIEIKTGQDGEKVMLQVADDGEGIDPHFLPHLFDPFRQADTSITRKHGGLGLGLSIARHIVELHNGSIHAKSGGIGHGATFIISLPRVSEPDETGESSRVESNAPAPHPPRLLEAIRILVVEDDEATRAALAAMLQSCGAEERIASSVREAWSICQAWRPDVVVSDIAMPDESGYELISRLRQGESPAGGRLPAIALTAHAAEEDRNKALASGFDIYLSKPVTGDQLTRAVAQLVGRTLPEQP